VSVDKPVAIGSDDAGYRLKGLLIGVLQEEGLEVADFGCHSEEPVVYPDVAFEVANAVARGDHDRGILICGTGIGMSIAANKVPGVRAEFGGGGSARKVGKINAVDGTRLRVGPTT
jgi:ribose 5-phosphate isomerase B